MIDLEQHWKDRAVVDGAALQRAIAKLQYAFIDIRNVKEALKMAEYKQDGREQFPVLLSESEVEILSACTALEQAIKNLEGHMKRHIACKSELFHEDQPKVFLTHLIMEASEKNQ